MAYVIKKDTLCLVFQAFMLLIFLNMITYLTCLENKYLT